MLVAPATHTHTHTHTQSSRCCYVCDNAAVAAVRPWKRLQLALLNFHDIAIVLLHSPYKCSNLHNYLLTYILTYLLTYLLLSVDTGVGLC